MDSNGRMRNEWNGVNDHIEVLLKVNSDLVVELERFCDDDDKVRVLVNRRARIEELSRKIVSNKKSIIKK